MNREQLLAQAKATRDARIEAARADYARDVAAINRVARLEPKRSDKQSTQRAGGVPRLKRGQLRDAITEVLSVIDRPFGAGRMLKLVRERRPAWNGELRRSSVAAVLKKLHAQGRLRLNREASGRRAALYEVVAGESG
ncbi:hypothetical protein RAS1_22730 [Phycisphaerae bacterium RAS1]|nr:hypothetical protein RAS1_22730 [Phycisphaerae bacterium RAS1]